MRFHPEYQADVGFSTGLVLKGILWLSQRSEKQPAERGVALTPSKQKKSLALSTVKEYYIVLTI